MRNRPPRLLQLITTLDPGGAEHMLLALTERLGGRFDSHVGYFKGGGGLASRFAAIGVPVHALGIRGRADWRCLRRTRRLIRTLRPDVIATHLFKADTYGAAAAFGTGIPVVCHKHNEDQYLLRRPIGALGRLVARRARAIVTISDAVSRFFVERAGFPADKLVRIHHGIAIGERAAPLDLATAFDLPADALVFGTVARLTEQKGIATLLDATARAVREAPRMRVVVVGDGEDRAALEAMRDRLGLTDVVRFAGRRDDVDAILAALDAFVLPSNWEGFGIVLLEAMAQACPVIATRVGGIPEVVDDGVTGRLIPAGDADALADGMLDVVRDPAATARRVSAATARLAERFSLDRMTDETAAVYERVIA